MILWGKHTFSLLYTLLVGQEPIRCVPCSPERLAECPAVDTGCEEVLREPGCGCCLACALKRGDSCGIYTAPCGSGLRCLPKPGEARPLHALTRGQAVCTETPEPDQNQSDNTPGTLACILEKKTFLQNVFKNNTHTHITFCESSLDGQRGKCWCVSSWNGKKIPGSSDLPADSCPNKDVTLRELNNMQPRMGACWK
uniref:Insulin-like growth factor-binding protein 1 n=1 Tax=Sinocyclocheilus rhinocerous TaxID=307959 RepID=A0A673NG46_9TELE